MTGSARSTAVFLWLASGHAALVLVAILAGYLGVAMRDLEPGAFSGLLDGLTTALTLPLTPLLRYGRIDLFFLLLPLNTFAYAALLSCGFLVVRRRRTTGE